jgi:5'-deoxynucleotidase YfbR-like HD superfamily hydrolase
MDIKKVLESGRVSRYHATLIDKKQTVDIHSWEVAVVLRHIYPNCSRDLLFYALTHDSAEIYTSDIAAPVKKRNPELKEVFDRMEDEYILETLKIVHPEFSTEEKLAVKYADIISGIYFTTCRVMAGDREAIPIRDKWLEYVGSLPYLNKATRETIEDLK